MSTTHATAGQAAPVLVPRIFPISSEMAPGK